MRPLMNLLFGVGLLLGGLVHGQSTYTIKPGDSLTKIARKHDCTVEALARENNLKVSSVIHPGQKLKIPGKVTAPPTASGTTAETHTIQPGETFSAISRQYGIPVNELLAANPGIDPKTLRPGQKIRLVSRQAAQPEPPAQPEETPQPETPAAQPAPPAGAEPAAENENAAQAAESIIKVTVDAEITYGEFAAKHGTDVERLNELNGYDLNSATVLARGSELYVPVKR